MNKSFVLITGASSGIGLELAHVFAQKKHNLVLVARNSERLKTLAQSLSTEHGVTVVAESLDLTKPESPRQLFEMMQKQNFKIDTLVNNAGFGYSGRFDKMPLDRCLDMIQLNITALTELTRLFLPPMVAQGFGQILNVASTAAFQPGPLMSVYYATKSYVLSFSEAIAQELEGSGVTVVALCPGPTETEFAREAQMELSRLFQNGGAMTARAVAEAAVTGLERRQRIVIPGFRNRFVACTVGLMPRRLVTKIVENLHKRVSTNQSF
jgi:short-subunit dehydrogenase